jgi:TPR repeat protein
MHQLGEGKDEKKLFYHLEEAAIGGHPNARRNLGCNEGNNGRMERDVKRFIIAANMRHEHSRKALWKCYAGDSSRKRI